MAEKYEPIVNSLCIIANRSFFFTEYQHGLHQGITGPPDHGAMKSIAFACSGEGRGHVSRILALSDFFDRSYRLSFWCPPTVAPLLRQKYPHGDINEVPYLELKKQNHQIHYPGTVAANSPHLFQAPRIIRNLARNLKDREATALISDFEPFSVHAAALEGIPIGLCRFH